MSEWQPIESVPKDGAHVLVLWKAIKHDKPEIIIAYWGNDMWGDSLRGVNVRALDGTGTIASLSNGWTGECLATHWMPLPAPPAEPHAGVSI